MEATRITRDQVIPLLLEACPSFQELWEEHCRDHDEVLLYVALGDFARHLLGLHLKGCTDAFPAVAGAIEQLHVEGDQFVREAATIGLLEGVQNNWEHGGVDPELFASHLHPVSARWWQSLNDF